MVEMKVQAVASTSWTGTSSLGGTPSVAGFFVQGNHIFQATLKSGDDGNGQSGLQGQKPSWTMIDDGSFTIADNAAIAATNLFDYGASSMTVYAQATQDGLSGLYEFVWGGSGAAWSASLVPGTTNEKVLNVAAAASKSSYGYGELSGLYIN